MTRKSGAHYQRMFRERLRAQGLIKKDVWILPEHASTLRQVEKVLRLPDTQPSDIERITMAEETLWNTQSLYEELNNVELFKSDAATLEIIEGTDQCLHIVMHEYADIPIFLSVSGEQILAEVILWSTEEINDVTAFNEEVLRTHKLLPLSSISLDRWPDGKDYYCLFGALSASSIIPSIVFEIETLADNVIKASEAYERFLVKQEGASA
ncbi:YjfI family protein [Spartinivicinus poritis]|uniref:YjfI family protein n=1 Tax=Spartinivicinus poritis TaxID=2994640 RepID=A0ABT5U5C2_9GAMM|nr:YjfI family protein [Spartinivicinus sp. A2-2]MDE1461559.1 YjfI family protein [Spartinivicinus sp. A2-2]